MGKIKIKNIETEEGNKSFGFIDVDKSSTTMYKFPISIINGSEPGSTLCLLGGIHGLEYSSIEAVIRVVKHVNPKKMRGVLLAVPVANQASFEARTPFINPIDGLNLNRCFPGDPKGTMSYRVAHTLFSEIISKADYLIDCHGGDLTEDIYDFLIMGISDDDRVNKTMMDMAACFNVKFVLTGLETDMRGQPISGTTMTATTVYGIPSITVESGRGGVLCEHSVEFIYDGLINTMKYLGMIEGKPHKYDYVLNPIIFHVNAEKGGLFHPKVKLGEKVSAGDTVATVTNVFGEIIQTVTSPDDSMVVFLRTSYAVSSGEEVMWLARLSEL